MKSREGKDLSFFYLYMLFFVFLVFQLTKIKSIWRIETIGTTVSAVSFFIMSYVAIRTITNRHFHKNIWIYYILPGVCIVAGMMANITWNVLGDLRSISFYGMMFPWIAYLAILFWCTQGEYPLEKMWKIYYLFMIVTTGLAIIDYWLTFYVGNHIRYIMASNGPYAVSLLALYHYLEDGSLYYRMYGVFREPGSLGMFIIPTLLYAWQYRKYIGFSVLLIGLYLSGSLGANIAFFMVAVFFFCYKFIKKRSLFTLLLIITLVSVIVLFFLPYLESAYQQKALSAEVRELAVYNTFKYFPQLAVKYIFGARIDETQNILELGFAPIYFLLIGGVLAMLGFMLCLGVSVTIAVWDFFCFSNSSKIEQVVLISIFPMLTFIMQRETIWSTGLFVFLFAPVIYYRLAGHQRSKLD